MTSGEAGDNANGKCIWTAEHQAAHRAASILLYFRIALTLFGMVLADMAERIERPTWKAIARRIRHPQAPVPLGADKH